MHQKICLSFGINSSSFTPTASLSVTDVLLGHEGDKASVKSGQKGTVKKQVSQRGKGKNQVGILFPFSTTPHQLMLSVLEKWKYLCVENKRMVQGRTTVRLPFLKAPQEKNNSIWMKNGAAPSVCFSTRQMVEQQKLPKSHSVWCVGSWHFSS